MCVGQTPHVRFFIKKIQSSSILIFIEVENLVGICGKLNGCKLKQTKSFK